MFHFREGLLFYRLYVGCDRTQDRGDDTLRVNYWGWKLFFSSLSLSPMNKKLNFKFTLSYIKKTAALRAFNKNPLKVSRSGG